jgi:hypothetical protein
LNDAPPLHFREPPLPTYRLVEFHAGGRVEVEEFTASGDDEAWARAREVVEADLVELWFGDELVRSTRH